MNRLLIVGRIVKDAELTYIQNTDGLAKLTFTVAVDRAYQKDKENKKTDFIPCVVLGKRAEALSPYITKGKQVAVQGELHIDNIKKNEEWKTYVTLQADIFEFLSNTAKEDKEQTKEQTGDRKFSAIEYDPFEVPF